MKINGYEINLSEEKLDKILSSEVLPIEMVSEDFAGYKNLKEGDKQALHHLVNAAKIVNNVSLEQDHHMNREMKAALEEASKSSDYAAKALKLFNMMNGVEGTNGIDKDHVEIFKGISGFPGRNFYPIDLKVKEFHEILKKMLKEGKVDEVQAILNPRSMVRRKDNELVAIDYTEYFKDDFKKIAEELELASQTVTNKLFREYLLLQIKALLENNNELDAAADIVWARMQDTDLEFTLSRENYDDEISPTVFDDKALVELLEKNNIEAHSKDMLGIRAGIINKEGTNLILEFKSHMCDLAKLMPHQDKYKQAITCDDDFSQTMVDADLAILAGDYAQCRGAITTAQNLPNNDKLSLQRGGGRRNVYHRQVRQAGDGKIDSIILNELVSPELHKYFNREADHLFVIGHENGHSFGPDSNFQSSVGIYRHVIEELKADIVSLALMPEYVKFGVISEEQLKEIYTTEAIMRCFLPAEPQLVRPHRVAELIIFNFLKDNGAVNFIESKLHIDFDKMKKACYDLLSETVDVQLSKSPDVAQKFIDKYTNWSDISIAIAKRKQELGVKPYKQIKIYF